MYIAQTPEARDIGRAEAAKHSIPLKPGVAEAIVPGIQGVVLIGEHGDYPSNEKGQKLYPRYELMEQIVKTYRETGRALPMFFDKHFSTEWKKAKQMFDWSRELKFPLIAGTSLTLTWRRPALELPLDAPVKRAVGYFYGDREAYGYHGIEIYQGMVERRQGGETGIDWVQCIVQSSELPIRIGSSWPRLPGQKLGRCVMQVFGDRKWVEIPGSETLELPPLLVNSALRTSSLANI